MLGRKVLLKQIKQQLAFKGISKTRGKNAGDLLPLKNIVTCVLKSQKEGRVPLAD